MSDQVIFKIISAQDWDAFRASGVYHGSADDRRDGFIHFSTGEQIPGTVQKHFAGRADVVLLRVSAVTIEQNLRWEPSRGGALFPHLYAPLPLAAVTAATPLGEDAAEIAAALNGERS